MDKTLELIVIALLGALCSILANKGIAVFNDGLRPILPEYLEKKIGKKELAATSFALSFGLVGLLATRIVRMLACSQSLIVQK